MCLISVTPQSGTEMQFSGMTKDITAMDWGDKDIECIPLVSGGNVVRKIPMKEESITMTIYPISAGASGDTTGTGVMQLFHPQGTPDASQPLAIPNSLLRYKHRLILLWAQTLPAGASTVPTAGQYAYRVQVFNAYLTSAKPKFDDKIMSVEVQFKWAPFQKDGTRNKIEESTDGSSVLPAVTAF